MKWAIQLQSGDVIQLADGSMWPAAYKQTARKLFALPEADKDACLHVFEVIRQADETIFLGKLHQLHVTPNGNTKVESLVLGLDVDNHRFYLIIHPHRVEIKHERI